MPTLNNKEKQMVRTKKLVWLDALMSAATSLYNPEIQKAKEIIEKLGFKVKFSKNLFSNTNKYSATASERVFYPDFNYSVTS